MTLLPSRDVFVVLPKDCDVEKLRFDQRIHSELVAPLSVGQQLGTLTISYGNLMMGTCDLVAMHSVAGQGSIVTEEERQDVTSWQEENFWKNFFSYGAFILLGIVILIFLFRAIAQGVRNAQARKNHRNRAKTKKRSR